ncbi:MAG TPA: hypothetical protein VMM77_10530 [Gemmatimonadaceae bacterium]|nr:hypothetical protein [Gemmatimonadaceae bacterium]
MRYIWKLWALALVACGGEGDPFARPESRIDATAAERGRPQEVPGFPVLSCIDSIAAEGSLREVTAIAPPGRRRVPIAKDSNWYPAQITDLEVLDSGFAVLDAGAVEVHLFSSDFSRRQILARSGQGPGEYQNPQAIAAPPGRDELWILDRNPPRVLRYSAQGDHLSTTSLDRTGLDLVVDSAGNFYVSHLAIPSALLERGADSLSTVVSFYAPDGRSRRDAVVMRRSDYGTRRFPLPGPNEIRLASLGGPLVAIIYTGSGVIEVFREGRLQHVINACMPERVLKAYAEQRAAFEKGTMSQRSFPLVTDVMLDPSGTMRAVGFAPDEDARYHIDSWELGTGQSAGSVAFMAPGVRLPPLLRFGVAWHDLVAAEEAGFVASFRVEVSAVSH